MVMMTTGCFPVWNNLAADAGVILLDGMLRAQLNQVLPDRHLSPASELVLPVAAADQKASFNVMHPSEETPESLFADPTSPNSFGLRLSSLKKRGVYTIERLADGDRENGWSRQYALTGPADESVLSTLDANDFAERYEGKDIQWLADDKKISMDGGFTSGQRLWKTFLALAIACLLIEMLMLRETRLKERAS